MCLYDGKGQGNPNKYYDSEREDYEMLSNHCSMVILKSFYIDVMRVTSTQDT